MLEGKDLILATKKYAVDERAKSWFHAISTIILLLLAFYGAYQSFHIAIRIASSILAGLLIVRLFVIYHDYAHNAILKDSLLARIIFSIWGLYVLAPKSIWKRSHDYHHKHNSKLYSSSIGSFPIVTKEKFLTLNKTERTIYLFVRHPLTIIFGYFTAFIYGMCIMSFVNSPSKHWDSLVALIFHFSIGAIAFMTFGWLGFLLGFLIPSMIGSGIGSYLFYAQHNFPTATFDDKEGWTYIGAALKSSSFMKMSGIMHWFTANIGYHHIHHANARIPFYRLPEVYDAFPEFQHPKTTSLSPVEIFRCLRLKVWDPQQNKMIGFSEMK
ncbi:MAG: fatty acid desaturase [Bacteroidia bacterium]|nr:fatty acid desaturase [Bacteroidia bacterium]NNM15665.1 fatty acid desaturase [Bacteroidia bacterium]